MGAVDAAGRQVARWAALLAGGLLCACSDKSDLPREIRRRRTWPRLGGDGPRGLRNLPCRSRNRLSQGRGGGALEGFAERPLIAGKFPNQPHFLIQWLRDAPSLSPQTAMPKMPITDTEARDIAAYLYTLDGR